jgi:hypothetical protein
MKTHAQVGTVLLTGLGIVGMAMAADQAPIAKLVRVDGTVIASQDARYIPAREGMSLKEGDRLMVLADGKAIVRFLDGCEYSLADQAVLVVQHVSTCASNGSGVYRVNPRSGVAGGTSPRPQPAPLAAGRRGARPNAIWRPKTPIPTTIAPARSAPRTRTRMMIVCPWQAHSRHW